MHSFNRKLKIMGSSMLKNITAYVPIGRPSDNEGGMISKWALILNKEKTYRGILFSYMNHEHEEYKLIRLIITQKFVIGMELTDKLFENLIISIASINLWNYYKKTYDNNICFYIATDNYIDKYPEWNNIGISLKSNFISEPDISICSDAWSDAGFSTKLNRHRIEN